MHESSIAWHKKVFFVRLLHLSIGPVTSAASLQAFPYGNTTQDERQSLKGYIRPVTSICNYECVSQSQMLPVSTVLVVRICDTQAGSMRLIKYPSFSIHCPPGRNRKPHAAQTLLYKTKSVTILGQGSIDQTGHYQLCRPMSI